MVLVSEGILYPLSRLVPALLERSYITMFRVYNELKFLEAELELSSSDMTTEALSDRLDRLVERVDHLSVPKAYMHMLYTLKQHISLVRQRLREGAREFRNPGLNPNFAAARPELWAEINQVECAPFITARSTDLSGQ